MTALVIIAKEPLPGRAKTRLHPPLSLEQAAALAAACIDDTVDAVRELPATERIIFYDGDIVPRSARDYRVVAQPSGTLDERLAAMFDLCSGPTMLIGMDTPQLAASDLRVAFEPWPTTLDVWFGPASDGGFWALGMREPTGDLVRGIPMSQSDTGERQLERIEQAGRVVGILPTLADVDTIDDAVRAAGAAPSTRFARLLNDYLGSALPEQ